MAIHTVNTVIYTCDWCNEPKEVNNNAAESIGDQLPGWFQVWVIGVMEPKHFHTATCALNMLQAANVAPEINIIIEETPVVPEPTPYEPEPEHATPDIPEDATPVDPEPATPNDPPEPGEPIPPQEPEPVVEEAEPEPPLDPDEPQPAP